MRHRRIRSPGGTFFFTVVTAARRPIFDDALAVASLRASLGRVRHGHPFAIDAIVVLPDHIHALWTLPAGDTDFSTRWMLVKSGVTRALRRRGITGPIWQPRYWDHMIRDERDFAAHADYIHYNPVRHGHARRPGDWRWSSFRRWIDEGRYESDWGSGGLEWADGVGRE